MSELEYSGLNSDEFGSSEEDEEESMDEEVSELEELESERDSVDADANDEPQPEVKEYANSESTASPDRRFSRDVPEVKEYGEPDREPGA